MIQFTLKCCSKPHHLPIVWNDWTMWQFSADGNGRGNEFGVESGNIDLNFYQGTYEKLLAWVDREPEEEPEYTLEEKVEILWREYLQNNHNV